MHDLRRTLRDAGVDVSYEFSPPTIVIKRDDAGAIVPVGDDVVIVGTSSAAVVRLATIPELFEGDLQPPDFARGPTDEYVPFFCAIEAAVVRYCGAAGRPENDFEMQRLYRLLLRAPGGADANPLFSYIQAAVRLYMSLHETSQAEFEAVVFRLLRSAKRFAQGRRSTNYVRIVADHLGALDAEDA